MNEENLGHSRIAGKDCRVFNAPAKQRIWLAFVLPGQAGIDMNSLRMGFSW